MIPSDGITVVRNRCCCCWGYSTTGSKPDRRDQRHGAQWRSRATQHDERQQSAERGDHRHAGHHVKAVGETVPLALRGEPRIVGAAVAMGRPDEPQERTEALGDQERCRDRERVPVSQLSKRNAKRCGDCVALRPPRHRGAGKQQYIGDAQQVAGRVERHAAAKHDHRQRPVQLNRNHHGKHHEARDRKRLAQFAAPIVGAIAQHYEDGTHARGLIQHEGDRKRDQRHQPVGRGTAARPWRARG
jgi:hypothetical protein